MTMAEAKPSDAAAAKALVSVLGSCRWEAVAYARGFLAIKAGKSIDAAAKVTSQNGNVSLKRSKEFFMGLAEKGFLGQLKARERTGSAQNPFPKMLPGRMTEQRFVEELDKLTAKRQSLTYDDERQESDTLVDFTLLENGDSLPINVKNAGTRFASAATFVGLDPDDCIPIPAYKATMALERGLNLLYAVAIDFDLVARVKSALPTIFTRQETIVYDLINAYTGSNVRSAETNFVATVVAKYWDRLKSVTDPKMFHVVSARKVIRIMNSMPKRTPGIGMKAWGTSARAEMNVHLSVKEDTTPWETIARRLEAKGIPDIVHAVNRKVMMEVYDPEI